jgi:rhamnose transport system permease protein
LKNGYFTMADTTVPLPDTIRHPRKAAFSYYWEVILAGVIVVELILIQIYFPRMLRPDIFLGITINFMEAGIVALFMAFIISSKNIDISVGALISLVSMTMALCVRAGLPDWAAIALGLLTGLIGGVFNGFLTAGLKIPSLVVTLGTMSLYRGITYVAFGDETFSAYSQSIRWLGRGKIFGAVPFPLLVFAILAVVSWFLLQRTTFGRQVYAVGNNDVASLYSGVRVKHLVIAVFAMGRISSLLSRIRCNGAVFSG